MLPKSDTVKPYLFAKLELGEESQAISSADQELPPATFRGWLD
jgi:hypothetical protein